MIKAIRQDHRKVHPRGYVQQHDTWIVRDGDGWLGEVAHIGFRQWRAEAMDGTRFTAASYREAVQRLRIHAAAPE